MDITIIAAGFLLKLVSALVAFVIARFALNNLDKAIGFNFKKWISHANDQAVSIYLGARILAICLLFAAIF